MSAPLRLGIIGLSEGNGHPYSWSAICNGYEPEEMESCGFPVIPRYLEQRAYPEDTIAGVGVTHVWTQDPLISAQVATAARIPNVCAQLEDMIGEVDGILLARDDAETHFDFAAPFLDAGLPVYIDKPIAYSLTELERIYGRQQYPGQIFTCSALRYAEEFRLNEEERAEIGPLRAVHAVTPKSWDHYAVHIIEPVLALIGDQGLIAKESAVRTNEGGAELSVSWVSGVRAHFAAMGARTSCPLGLRVMGERGWRDLFFRDTFSAFRAAIQDFVDGIRCRDIRSDPEFVRRVVDIIERGRDA